MDGMRDATTLEKQMVARAAALGRPINGSLELTPLCTMDCGMCYVRLSREEMAQKGRLRTAEEYIALAQEMARAGVLFLLLTGGEPLLFPGFQKLYTALKGMGFVLTVNTNGTLLDESWADFFARHRPRRVNITLYGASAETYEKLCRCPGGYEKAVKAVHLLKERGVDVKINGSATRLNRQDMAEIYRIGQELDVPVHTDCYMVPALHERGLPGERQTRLDPEGAARAEIEALWAELGPEGLREYAAQLTAEREKEEKEYGTGIFCLAGNCSFTVNWQGELRPCVSLSEPSVPVFERGFEAAWQEIREKAKGLHMNEKCGGCPLRPLCKVCPAAARLETGDYDGVPEYLCRNAQELYRLLKREV